MHKITCVILFAWCVDSYRILGIFPLPGRSHFNVFEPLLKELSRRGHDVTVISHFPQNTKMQNYTDVSLVGTSETFLNTVPINAFKLTKFTMYFHVLDLAYFTNSVCENGFRSRELQYFMRNKGKYDVVITQYFAANCFLGLIHNTDAALIGITSCGLLPWINDYIGQPDNPSYIPTLYTDFQNKMTFFQRVENILTYFTMRVLYDIYIDAHANRQARKYIDKNLPDLNTFAYNTSLVLTNVYQTLSGSKPLVPNVVEVGGMHIGERKNLPQNIEKWINESTHGVIYFSMGSMIKGHTFPEEKRNMFLRAFGRLQQRVLWKWENDTMPKKPDNVMIQKWMPQFDILCHPNVKAFISHGGLLGTTEAVHCGVPAVVMPQYGDQYTNARALEASGGGVILQFSTLTEEDVYNSLKTVLDPSFNKKAKELSERFRDRPMPPLETAIYWVEYVARHKGAPHLRTAAVGMPLYQYLLLDVIAFLLLVFAILTYTSYVVIKFIFRKLFKKQTKEKEN